MIDGTLPGAMEAAASTASAGSLASTSGTSGAGGAYASDADQAEAPQAGGARVAVVAVVDDRPETPQAGEGPAPVPGLTAQASPDRGGAAWPAPQPPKPQALPPPQVPRSSADGPAPAASAVGPGRLVLQRPLVAFDLETTGLSVTEDRIVEVSCVKIHPSGEREVRTRRLNPERPISEEASAVHGIRDEDVRDCPTFRQIARGLYQFLDGCDLTGFNLSQFDLPMLRQEFARCGCLFPPPGTRILDSRTIYLMKEPRSLAAALRHYCGRDLQDAHSAECDATAAADILLAQIDRYDDLPNTIEGLVDWCHPERGDWIDEDGKLYWRDGEAAINFGKYRGRLLREVVEQDREYLDWVAGSDFPPEVVQIIGRALGGDYPTRPPAAPGDPAANDG